MNALLLSDGYKTGHHKQYPKGTELVYSNWTARSNKYAPEGCDKIVSFGQQYAIKWLNEYFKKNFFEKTKEEVCGEMRTELSMYLGTDYDVSHFEALHDLGYLPISVKSLPEGVEVPMRVPLLTIVNTNKDFYWITNYLETIISNLLWLPMTAATIALKYKRIFTQGALETDKDSVAFVDFQGHNFAMRGMEGLQGTVLASMGHSVVFMGDDSLPVIHTMRKFYNADGFIVGSVNATEHSVMCAGTKDDEIGTFRHLMAAHPTGILSIVSDTWDLWKVINELLPVLKNEILARDGTIVIRPDSGDPVNIICGWEHPNGSTKPEAMGVVELLWFHFGGTVNEQGYKVLDSHIGAIYGDSITPLRAQQMMDRLKAKGFATTNVVLGIGSYTYQYNTRDTFGFAMKATYVEVNGEGREIFKDPITDDGTKKSAKGLMCVTKHNEENYMLVDQVSWETENNGELTEIYRDGHMQKESTLNEIRERINGCIRI